MVDKEEKYGGIFLYEVSGGKKPAYIIANPDRVRELLSNHFVDWHGAENSEQVTIKRLGQVSIDSLTLDRLVEEVNERARLMGKKK